jgi:hypothetical protein
MSVADSPSVTFYTCNVGTTTEPAVSAWSRIWHDVNDRDLMQRFVAEVTTDTNEHWSRLDVAGLKRSKEERLVKIIKSCADSFNAQSKAVGQSTIAYEVLSSHSPDGALVFISADQPRMP